MRRSSINRRQPRESDQILRPRILTVLRVLHGGLTADINLCEGRCVLSYGFSYMQIFTNPFPDSSGAAMTAIDFPPSLVASPLRIEKEGEIAFLVRMWTLRALSPHSDSSSFLRSGGGYRLNDAFSGCARASESRAV